MEISPEKETLPDDPFAEDIFAAPQPEEIQLPDEMSVEKEADKSKVWFQLLPKVPRPQIVWDELLLNLPAKFFGKFPKHLADSLARLLVSPSEKNIEFVYLIKRETEKSEINPLEKSRWLIVGIEESKAEFAFEIDDAFAAWLIDTSLGAEDNIAAAREFTASELAVLEFLCLNLAAEANRLLKQPVFRFRSLNRELPDWLRRDKKTENSPLMVVNWQTVHGVLPSIVKMYFAPESLQALQTGENRSFKKRSGGTPDSLQSKMKKMRIRLPLGNIELSYGDLAALENGDVILPEEHNLYLNGGNLAGEIEVIIGDGRKGSLSGEIFGSNFELSFAGENAPNADNKLVVRRINPKNPLQIRINKFSEEEIQEEEKEIMATSENTNDEAAEEKEAADLEIGEEIGEDQTGLAVENLVVTLRVELDGRRLSLAEVGNLRENQVLELGIRPTDAVNLKIDNQTVGRGELVAVEDRLGVRITKLLR